MASRKRAVAPDSRAWPCVWSPPPRSKLDWLRAISWNAPPPAAAATTAIVVAPSASRAYAAPRQPTTLLCATPRSWRLKGTREGTRAPPNCRATSTKSAPRSGSGPTFWGRSPPGAREFRLLVSLRARAGRAGDEVLRDRAGRCPCGVRAPAGTLTCCRRQSPLPRPAADALPRASPA